MSHVGSAWAASVRGINSAQKALLYALGEHHNKETGLCFPSQALLAAEACMSDRTVARNTGDLERMGFLERFEVRHTLMVNGKKQTTHSYYVLNLEQTFPVEHWKNIEEKPPVRLSGEDLKAWLTDPTLETDRPDKYFIATRHWCRVHNKPEGTGKEIARARDSKSGKGKKGFQPPPAARELNLDIIPRGLKSLAKYVSQKHGPGKAECCLEKARFISSNGDGETIVQVPSVWAHKLEDYGRAFLKEKGWKVQAL